MMAVSSFKDLGKSSEVAKNQIDANRSWQDVFSTIVYFNSYEPRLASGKTVFVTSEEWPPIWKMAEICADAEGWACIINSDIIVTSALLVAEHALNRHTALTATSRRLTFNDEDGIDRAKYADLGLDIFIARPGVWREVADTIPKEFRIGHVLWDTWMAGYFNSSGSYYDLTPFKCIYHRDHEFRDRPHDIPMSLKSNEYVRAANFPKQQLTVT